MRNLYTNERLFEDLFGFRREFDEMFNRILSGKPWGLELPEFKKTFNITPAAEAHVDKEAKKYVCRVTLPGVEPKDLQIHAQANVLTIRGERKLTHSTKEIELMEGEIVYGVLESPLEHAIDDLPFHEFDLFRAVSELPLPANREHIRLCMDLQVLRLHARQCHAADILLGFFVHMRFRRRSNVEGLLELRQLKTPGLAAQNAIEHLVELTAKTKQILEQPFIGIQISHDILLN